MKRKQRNILFIVIAIVLVAALVVGIVLLAKNCGGEDDPHDQPGPDPGPMDTAFFNSSTFEYKLNSDYKLTDLDVAATGGTGSTVGFTKAVTIDLNGHTLDLNSMEFNVLASDPDCTVLFKNGTVKGGKLTLSAAAGNVRFDGVVLKEDVTDVTLSGSVTVNESVLPSFALAEGQAELTDSQIGKLTVPASAGDDAFVRVDEVSSIGRLDLSAPAYVDVEGAILDVVLNEEATDAVIHAAGTAVIGNIIAKTDALIDAENGASIKSLQHTEEANVSVINSAVIESTEIQSAEELEAATGGEHIFVCIEKFGASCEEDGHVTFKCIEKDCNETRTVVIPGGHIWEYEVLRKPTKLLDGLTRKSCARCGMSEEYQTQATPSIEDCETISELLAIYVPNCNIYFSMDEDTSIRLNETPVNIQELLRTSLDADFTVQRFTVHILSDDTVLEGLVDFKITLKQEADVVIECKAYLSGNDLYFFFDRSDDDNDAIRLHISADDEFEALMQLIDLGDLTGNEFVSILKKAKNVAEFLERNEDTFVRFFFNALSKINLGTLDVIFPDLFTVSVNEAGENVYSFDLTDLIAFLNEQHDATGADYLDQILGDGASASLLTYLKDLPEKKIGALVDEIVLFCESTDMSEETLFALVDELVSIISGEDIKVEDLLSGFAEVSIASLIDKASFVEEWQSVFTTVETYLSTPFGDFYDSYLGDVYAFDSLIALLGTVDETVDFTFTLDMPETEEEVPVLTAFTVTYGDIADCAFTFDGETVTGADISLNNIQHYEAPEEPELRDAALELSGERFHLTYTATETGTETAASVVRVEKAFGDAEEKILDTTSCELHMQGETVTYLKLFKTDLVDLLYKDGKLIRLTLTYGDMINIDYEYDEELEAVVLLDATVSPFGELHYTATLLEEETELFKMLNMNVSIPMVGTVNAVYAGHNIKDAIYTVNTDLGSGLLTCDVTGSNGDISVNAAVPFLGKVTILSDYIASEEGTYTTSIHTENDPGYAKLLNENPIFNGFRSFVSLLKSRWNKEIGEYMDKAMDENVTLTTDITFSDIHVDAQKFTALLDALGNFTLTNDGVRSVLNAVSELAYDLLDQMYASEGKFEYTHVDSEKTYEEEVLTYVSETYNTVSGDLKTGKIVGDRVYHYDNSYSSTLYTSNSAEHLEYDLKTHTGTRTHYLTSAYPYVVEEPSKTVFYKKSEEDFAFDPTSMTMTVTESDFDKTPRGNKDMIGADKEKNFFNPLAAGGVLKDTDLPFLADVFFGDTAKYISIDQNKIAANESVYELHLKGTFGYAAEYRHGGYEYATGGAFTNIGSLTPSYRNNYLFDSDTMQFSWRLITYLSGDFVSAKDGVTPIKVPATEAVPFTQISVNVTIDLDREMLGYVQEEYDDSKQFFLTTELGTTGLTGYDPDAKQVTATTTYHLAISLFREGDAAIGANFSLFDYLDNRTKDTYALTNKDGSPLCDYEYEAELHLDFDKKTVSCAYTDYSLKSRLTKDLYQFDENGKALPDDLVSVSVNGDLVNFVFDVDIDVRNLPSLRQTEGYPYLTSVALDKNGKYLYDGYAMHLVVRPMTETETVRCDVRYCYVEDAAGACCLTDKTGTGIARTVDFNFIFDAVGQELKLLYSSDACANKDAVSKAPTSTVAEFATYKDILLLDAKYEQTATGWHVDLTDSVLFRYLDFVKHELRDEAGHFDFDDVLDHLADQILNLDKLPVCKASIDILIDKEGGHYGFAANGSMPESTFEDGRYKYSTATGADKVEAVWTDKQFGFETMLTYAPQAPDYGFMLAYGDTTEKELKASDVKTILDVRATGLLYDEATDTYSLNVKFYYYTLANVSLELTVGPALDDVRDIAGEISFYTIDGDAKINEKSAFISGFVADDLSDIRLAINFVDPNNYDNGFSVNFAASADAEHGYLLSFGYCGANPFDSDDLIDVSFLSHFAIVDNEYTTTIGFTNNLDHTQDFHFSGVATVYEKAEGAIDLDYSVLLTVGSNAEPKVSYSAEGQYRNVAGECFAVTVDFADLNDLDNSFSVRFDLHAIEGGALLNAGFCGFDQQFDLMGQFALTDSEFVALFHFLDQIHIENSLSFYCKATMESREATEEEPEYASRKMTIKIDKGTSTIFYVRADAEVNGSDLAAEFEYGDALYTLTVTSLDGGTEILANANGVEYKATIAFVESAILITVTKDEEYQFCIRYEFTAEGQVITSDFMGYDTTVTITADEEGAPVIHLVVKIPADEVEMTEEKTVCDLTLTLPEGGVKCLLTFADGTYVELDGGFTFYWDTDMPFDVDPCEFFGVKDLSGFVSRFAEPTPA